MLHGGEYQAKVPVEALAAVYQLERSIPSRGEVGTDLVKLVLYNKEPGGASRSSPRLALPSFSTEEEDNDEGDEDNNNNDDDDKVDFPNQGNIQRRRQTVQRGKQPRNPIATKNLNLIMAPKQGKSGFTEIAAWNRSAHQGAWNETKRGWMAKHE